MLPICPCRGSLSDCQTENHSGAKKKILISLGGASKAIVLRSILCVVNVMNKSALPRVRAMAICKARMCGKGVSIWGLNYLFLPTVEFSFPFVETIGGSQSAPVFQSTRVEGMWVGACITPLPRFNRKNSLRHLDIKPWPCHLDTVASCNVGHPRSCLEGQCVGPQQQGVN